MKPKAISLYTGAGGLDLGLEAAGFVTSVAVEMSPVACRTLRLNRSFPVLEHNIHDVPTEVILSAGGLRPGDAEILVGGPPCQPFSKSGYWVTGDASRLDDPRSDTLEAFLRVLRDAKPTTFLLENVYGLAYKGKDEGLSYFLRGVAGVNKAAGTNYSVSWKVLNAADYGVPQRRERVFVIGSRDGARFSFPKPTHGECAELEPNRTCWDAIGDLNDQEHPSLAVGGKWGELLPSIPEGENYLWHTERGGGLPLFGWRRRYWSFLLKLAKAQPSWTIQAQPGSATGPFHWRSRKLSAKELCRLQTFPEDFKLDCSRMEAQRLLGNAVPSLLAEVLGLEIRRQLLGSTVRRRSLTLMPPLRRPAPSPEPALPVPKQYHQLIGEHAAHPGEGRGKGAKQRSQSREQLDLAVYS